MRVIRRLRCLLVVCCLVPLIAPVQAQSKVGTTAASFLEVGVGARSVALGEAAAAAAGDVSAIYWNPAGIAAMTQAEAAFEYTQWFAGTSLQYAAAVVPVGGGQVGLHAYVFDSGEMDVTTVEEPGEFTGERFSVQNLSLGVSYARSLTTNFAVGGTAKFITERISSMRASSVALDIGIQYRLPIQGLSMGFALTNFGAEMQLAGADAARRIDLDPNTSGDSDAIISNLNTRSWDLPLMYRIGVSYRVVDSPMHQITLATDARYPNNNDRSMSAGAEYGFQRLLFLRAGYANLFLSETLGMGHLRLGAGLRIKDRFRADYAFADRGDLGRVNMVGVGLLF